MDYYLQINEEQHGPYSEEDILSKLQSREINGSDLIWYEELDDWEYISNVLDVPVVKRPPPIKKTRSAEENEIVVAEPYAPAARTNPFQDSRQEAPRESQPLQPQQVVNQHVEVQTSGGTSNGLGVAGFIFALLGLFIAWIPYAGWVVWGLGFLFSFIGIFISPRGLAIAGCVVSAIWGVIFIIYNEDLIGRWIGFIV